jgi:hypothetical protein
MHCRNGLIIKISGYHSLTIMDIYMEDAGTDEEQTGIRIRPGYTEQIRDNQVYIRPSVFGSGPEFPLATTKKPDFSQAVEMPGGVS